MELNPTAPFAPAHIILSCTCSQNASLSLPCPPRAPSCSPPSGQRCTAVKLVAVVDSVADQLVALVAAAVAKLRVGRPEDDADITPVVSESSANFIEGLVVDAREKGGW